ncbi:hypothetical protein SASPL_147181 [Salvia splendens]|uniref:TF-B3 domain-containing protein n=1 Tax=Salvia splendens TaxID=180675 RepID=A0A8X8Z5L1_SALSN|nr:hypothetical protein SASPL_147181 [Salvia splendens]
MGALQAPVYFLTQENTWMLTLMHSSSNIWVKHGWKRFRRVNGLVVGDRCHFTLVNPDEDKYHRHETNQNIRSFHDQTVLWDNEKGWVF